MLLKNVNLPRLRHCSRKAISKLLLLPKQKMKAASAYFTNSTIKNSLIGRNPPICMQQEEYYTELIQIHGPLSPPRFFIK